MDSRGVARGNLWITLRSFTRSIAACDSMRNHPHLSSTPLTRPTLLPGLRRLWRGPRTLQLGTDPARAVVLDLPDPSAARLLDLLDGARSERAALAAAVRRGVDRVAAEALLAALRQAGLVVGAQSLLPHNLPEPPRRRLRTEVAALALSGTGAPATPAQILRRRRAARIVVTGHGRLAAPVALALAAAGVGHVRPALPGPAPPADPMLALVAAEGGDSLGTAVSRAIERAAPGTRTGPVHRREASFAVQVGGPAPATLAAARYAHRRLPHLVVGLRDGTAVVGPAGAAGRDPLPQLRGPAPSRPRPGLALARRPTGRATAPTSRTRSPPRWSRPEWPPPRCSDTSTAGCRRRSAPRWRSPDPRRHAVVAGHRTRSVTAPSARAGGRPVQASPARAGVRHNGRVSDIPRRAVSRTAQLAGLPLGFAGRTALGLGKRVTGLASEVISADIQQRTAEHLFRVLGQLKGGAMKFGQALSVFEAAMPEELAGPYRQALTRLQEAAPPMPAATVHKVLAEQLGADWRHNSSSSTTSRPPPPASVRSTGRSGRRRRAAARSP